MVSINFKNRQTIVITLAILISIILIIGYFASGNDKPQAAPRTTTTTTTLPPKDAQACEYLTPETLLAGGIIPDVDPKTKDNRRRCSYEDIGGNINYITLYVDIKKRCEVWLEDAVKTKELPEINKNAVFVSDTDPTIIVPQGDRCFFLQGSKTLVTQKTLTAIAKAISDLLIAVDTSTTTTTEATVVLPEDTTPLPGVNRATTTPPTSA